MSATRPDEPLTDLIERVRTTRLHQDVNQDDAYALCDALDRMIAENMRLSADLANSRGGEPAAAGGARQRPGRDDAARAHKELTG